MSQIEAAACCDVGKRVFQSGTDFALAEVVPSEPLLHTEGESCLPALPGPLRALPANAPAPRRIAGYRLHALLGSGGMATVYLAERESQLGRRRWCALKVPNTSLSGSAYDRMFLTEARIGAELHHPNVCGVFDYGLDNGRAYIAMEYASGRSLLDIFRTRAGRRCDTREARLIARLLTDVCEGLQAIHDQSSVTEGPLRLVHRDISPDNVILTCEGFTKIIDLGLVKTEQRGEVTNAGFVKGKISYVAPELLGGESATRQADVWSLGVVAWELLTGERLFHEATDIATLRKVIDHQIVAPSEVAKGLPQELDAIVLRALARNINDRYESAAEFAEALWAFLAKQPKMVQHAELAAWMAELFPGERQRVESLLHALGQPAVVLEGPPASRSRVRSLPKMANLLRRIRTRSSVSLRSMPLRRRALASVGIAFVLGGLAVVSQLGWSKPSSALPLSDGTTPALHAPKPPMEDASLTPSDLVVNVERAAGSSDLVLRIRAPRSMEAPSGPPALPAPLVRNAEGASAR